MRKKIFPVALILTAALATGTAVASALELREVNRRLAVSEAINEKQTRALFVIAGGLDDLNQQEQREQRRRELDEKMKELFQKGPAL